MILTTPLSIQNPLRNAITAAYRMDETECVNHLIKQLLFSEKSLEQIEITARELVIGTRENLKKESMLSSFLRQYDLSSQEGIALMCLAEALLRIPDSETIDRLISDKLSATEWISKNASSWSLSLAGKIFAPATSTEHSLGATFKRIGSRLGSSMLRPMVVQGMKMLGNHFVMGQTIEEALRLAKKNESTGYSYSFDMLGEAARTQYDAEKYFQAYVYAIESIGKNATHLNPFTGPGISVKLSALHPRYEFNQSARVLKELTPHLLHLAKLAKQYNIGLTVDAEEADRLDLSLDIFERVFNDAELNGWEGLGLAVQAYQKRAPFVIDWLADLSKTKNRRILVRLVKGAYWDSEIKVSQVLGLEGYPVFTRKSSTDISFLTCSKKLISQPQCFYPQFGTHNAYTVAAILEMIGTRKDYEFQCLYGMGESLYDQLVPKNIPCRIYAPVGTHRDLLGYLVRRLLENGANTSFINHLANDKISIEYLTENPLARIASLTNKANPNIPLPKDIFATRINSAGFDFSNRIQLNELKKAMELTDKELNPIKDATMEDLSRAISLANDSKKIWEETSLDERAQCLERAADLFEKNKPQLMTLLTREGKKQIFDCHSEIRETVDFCRYYAEQARKNLQPQILPGPTGESNQLSLHPRGVIACISPWNFPLAIFTGQIVAALVCGNTVIAKPSEQTPSIAAYAVELLHQAGIPKTVLQLLTGQGETIGAGLVNDPRIAGVIFTGSTETAQLINQTLANRSGAIVPLIAETGGQNAMIVDSSALPEQVVVDVIQSAFNSAGQRCSALRVLFIQEEIAPRLLEMLIGAMKELTIGDPSLLSTDVGPVIDREALNNLQKHFEKMNSEAKLLYQVPLQKELSGTYFAPCIFELKELNQLKREVFGPILHVIRYSSKELDNVLESIINTGYGLTLGIHSRINATIDYIIKRMPVGNTYVNRNMIGAVVGVQPFGGENLSGTGPKAGGPHYLMRLCVERSISVNTTAAGGNASLLTLEE